VNKESSMQVATQSIGFFALMLPAVIEIVLIWPYALSLLHSIQLPPWCATAPVFTMALTALPFAMISAYEKARLPELALFLAASVAGLVWPVLLFYNQAFGLAGLWLLVGGGISIATAEDDQFPLARIFLLANSVLQLLLAIALFALAASGV